MSTNATDNHYLFDCPFCTKKFVKFSDADRHIKSHIGEKPYSCTYPGCSKTFNRKDNMQQHLRCHFSNGYIAKRELKRKEVRKLKIQVLAEYSTKVLDTSSISPNCSNTSSTFSSTVVPVSMAKQQQIKQYQSHESLPPIRNLFGQYLS